ncbi:MAG: trigger factor [Candidatus Berkelbacteria bacterium Licking1014_2]|uniref:Trigger factor n=1 Tax=Candidatus Berkelbacteria bacterium Licking1014_2 TaxID=2017146 RepID=A0A554LXZ0_9BACT|nr:MAG: trigger factor [Candidatus Berkelbacteria bacterium Licking1014_2]
MTKETDKKDDNQLALKIEKLPRSRVKLTITVSKKTTAAAEESVYQKLASQVNIPGFRPGQAPRRLTIEKIGSGKLAGETAHFILDTTYPQVIQEQKLLPLQAPAVKIIAEKEEFIYEAEVDVMPEIKMGDYSKIRLKKHQKIVPTKEEEIKKETDRLTGFLKKEHGEKYWEKLKLKDEKEAQEQIKKASCQRLENQAKGQQIDELLDEGLKLLDVDVPQCLVDGEIDRLINLTRQRYPGDQMEELLKKEKKTIVDLRQDWEKQAEKTVKIGLLLGQVMQQEKIDHHQSDASRQAVEKMLKYATIEVKSKK